MHHQVVLQELMRECSIGCIKGELTLASRVLAPTSRRGSLKRRLVPFRLTFRVTMVSGVAVDGDAILPIMMLTKPAY